MEELINLNACKIGIEFARKFSSIREAWDNCHRGDWMLWYAANKCVDKRALTLAKGLCANTVRHLMTDERSIAAVDAAISYGNGEITDAELRYVAVNAYSAANSNAYVDSNDSAYIAAYAASNAYVDSKSLKSRETANICREILTEKIFAVYEHR